MKLYALILTILCFNMALVFASKNKAQLSRRRMVEKIVERDDVNVEKRLAGHGMREVTVRK